MVVVGLKSSMANHILYKLLQQNYNLSGLVVPIGLSIVSVLK